MKNFRLSSIAISLLASIFVLCSCVNTETVEPSNPEKSNKIVINIGSPEQSQTRGDSDHSGHKLRYIAKLYQSTRVIDRKEVIEGELGNGTQRNQLVFDVEPDNYILYVFADYIPEDYVAKDYLFEDLYYWTEVSSDAIKMNAVPGLNNKDDQVNDKYFNNDNYDCFSKKITVKKEASEVVLNVTLERAVAKIRLVDTSRKKGSYKIGISQLGYIKQYGINDSTAAGLKTLTSKSSNLVELTKEFEGNEDQEIMYYYVFASKSPEPTDKLSLQVSLTDENGNNKTVLIDNIEVNQNHITTIKGSFLPEASQNNPGGDNGNSGNNNNPDDSGNSGNNGNGGENPSTKNGPIYLNLSVPSEDFTQSQNSNWNLN